MRTIVDSTNKTGRILSSILVTGGLFLMALEASAVSPEVWKTSAYKEFAEGDGERVAIVNPGEIRLSPSHSLFAKIPESSVWSLVESEDGGTLYAGTGNRARIYKVTREAEAATAEAKLFADLEGNAIHGLVMGSDGFLYAGVSPGGNVYKISPEGAVTLVGDSKQTYIWAMDFDDEGNLVLATGDKGVLLRMGMDGTTKKIVETGEKHILSLIREDSGKTYIGTAPSGWVGVVDASADFRVLYDSALSEVKALALDVEGNLYAGIIPSLKVEPQPDNPQTAAAQEAKPKADKNSELVKISPDGLALPLLKTENAAINSLFLYDNNLLIGTGDEGILYRLGQRDSTDFLVDLESSDILTVVPRTDGGVWMGTANPSSLHLLPVGTNDGGVYAVKPLDAGVSAQWGALSWKASVPEGATLDFQTRSGNTEEPDDNWSDWSAPLTDPNPITSPPARFLQWRARFGGTQEGESATVFEVEAVYQKINQPPRITTSKVGNHVSSTAGDSSSSSNGKSSGSKPSSSTSQKSDDANPGSSSTLPIAWQSSDGNGDTLVYDLHFRRVGETLWKEIEKDLKSTKHTWNLSAMPDGDYEIRITASDRTSNPANLALKDEWISEPVRVDTTPPKVGEWKNPKAEGSTFSVEVQVHDETSRLVTVERVVDGKEEESEILLPGDGILDSSSEHFEIQLTDLESGEHSLSVRAKDELGNIGADSMVFKIP